MRARKEGKWNSVVKQLGEVGGATPEGLEGLSDV